MGLSEWKAGACAAFDIEVAGHNTNTTWGVSSNLGVGTGVRLPFGTGVSTGMELAVSAGMGAGTNSLGVPGGLRVA